jgi:phosphoadenosine phosphosulfate reductase
MQTLTTVTLRPRPAIDAAELDRLGAELESATPTEIIRWAHERFGHRLALTASFADTTLIDLATAVVPDIEVIFLDTGFHFAETLNVVRRAMERRRRGVGVRHLTLDVHVVCGPHGSRCCRMRPGEPLAPDGPAVTGVGSRHGCRTRPSRDQPARPHQPAGTMHAWRRRHVV